MSGVEAKILEEKKLRWRKMSSACHLGAAPLVQRVL